MTRLVLLAAALCALALPSSAFGAVVRVEAGVLIYEGGVNEGNSVTFDVAGANILVDEVAQTLTPGPGCVPGVDSTDALCPAAGITSTAVDLGDGQDGVTMNVSLPASMAGGEGNDTLRGGPSDDTLLGETGGDIITGGDGIDTVSYADKTESVTVDIDGDAGDDGNLTDDDGFGGRDTVGAGVENIIGGRGGDVLNGDGADNVMTGGPGPDVMGGAGGSDTADYSDHAEAVVVDIGGGSGDGGPSDGAVGARDNVSADFENLKGGAGDDSLSGSGGANALAGGPGGDRLAGGAGPDWLGGGDGADTADFSDHADGVTVSIGGGANDGNSTDGADGARDDVQPDVENLRGGSGGDTLAGDGNPNGLEGGPGDDALDGGGGPDVLGGGDGSDRVAYESRTGDVKVTFDGRADDGQAGENDNVGADMENADTGGGADTVDGSGAGNRVNLGGGEDYADGADGADALGGGDARDALRSRDGVADDVACGPDVDFAIADPADRVNADCERVDRGVNNRPRLGREVVVRPAAEAGLGLPGVKRLVPLKDRVNVPVRTSIDSSFSPVRITTATGVRGRTQGGVISRGAFRISQARRRNAVTQLALTGGDFGVCASARAAGGVHSSQSRRRRTVRRLFANVKGRFRAKGRHSSATVRGTRFEVIDRCDGTLTRVRSGSVVVRDRVRRRTVVVRAGRQYLARAAR